MNPAYLSALAALVGATIGGLTSFLTSWLTQRVQLRYAQRESERAKLETLYSDFIVEASRLFGDAAIHQTEDVTAVVSLYAMVGRMHLVSDRKVVDAAARVVHCIIETYLGPNRTLHEMLDFAQAGGMDFLTHFGEVCRQEIIARASAIR